MFSVCEHQISEHIETFEIPQDYQGRILEGHRELRTLNSDGDTSKNLDQLAEFLGSEASASDPATQEQRNNLVVSPRSFDTI